jgi:GxxExxY protein
MNWGNSACQSQGKSQCLSSIDGQVLDGGYRLDLLVADTVIVELKSVEERLLPVHGAQLLSYLRLSGRKLGYVLNFNVVHMREGVKRVVNNL